MTGIIIFCAVVIGVAILTPLFVRLIQDRDYKRQMTGKRPMRQAKEGTEQMGAQDKKEGEDSVIQAMNMKAKTDAYFNSRTGL